LLFLQLHLFQPPLSKDATVAGLTQSPATQCTDPGSTPGLSTWDFLWNKWQWDTCFCKYTVVPRPYYFTNAACSFIHVSRML